MNWLFRRKVLFEVRDDASDAIITVLLAYLRIICRRIPDAEVLSPRPKVCPAEAAEKMFSH